MSILASDLVTAVLGRLAQNSDNPAFWTRSEILQWLWEGLVELQLISERVQIEHTQSLGNNSITGAPAEIAVIGVRCGNEALPHYSIDEIDGRYPTWEDDPQRPYPKAWAPLGCDKIITYPRESRTDQSLTFIQLQLPGDVSETTTLPLDAEYGET